jgi:hypothetical protein
MDHGDIGIAINQREVKMNVVEDLDTATASKCWSLQHSRYPAQTALREHNM